MRMSKSRVGSWRCDGKMKRKPLRKLKKLQTELEQKRYEGDESESQADFTRAAAIRYKEIPLIEGKFKKAQARLKRLQKTRKILREEVTEEDIAHVIARWTGIPATKMLESEAKKLTRIEEELKKQIVGQDESIHKISSAIKRSRVGIANPNRPVGSFLFLGPTGVGKSELAKQLARYIFDDRESTGAGVTCLNIWSDTLFPNSSVPLPGMSAMKRQVN